MKNVEVEFRTDDELSSAVTILRAMDGTNSLLVRRTVAIRSRTDRCMLRRFVKKGDEGTFSGSNGSVKLKMSVSVRKTLSYIAAIM